MRSTFHGLEIGKRALFAQQSALSTTGHNISNANTEGYSRQRAVMKPGHPIPYPGMTMDKSPGQIGTGVEVSELQRVREGFLDLQFRGENKFLGYWEAKSDTLSKIETVMNEPSETGLSNTMDKFWQSWQDLSKEPESLAARSVVRQRGISVTETFSHIMRSLDQLQNDLNTVVKVKVDDINSIAQQIKDLNDQISRIVPHGHTPNDLFDQRDLLVDRLSKLVNVDVEPAAQGMVNVFVEGEALVEGTDVAIMETSPNASMDGLVDVQLDGSDLNLTSGELQGLIESRGTMVEGEFTGIIPEIREKVNTLATTFVQEINTVHKRGMNMDDINARKAYEDAGGTGTEPKLDNLPFFIDKDWYEANKDDYTLTGDAYKSIDPDSVPDPTDADNMMVNPLIIASLNKISAAKPEEMTAEEQLEYGTSFEGDGRNARDIAAIKFELMQVGGGETTTLDDYYRNTIAQLGVDSQESQRMYENADVLVGQVDRRRDSVSGVSLDEEMANMIKFQHAYNAAARSVTTMDEVLDRVINGMGRVGR